LAAGRELFEVRLLALALALQEKLVHLGLWLIWLLLEKPLLLVAYHRNPYRRLDHLYHLLRMNPRLPLLVLATLVVQVSVRVLVSVQGMAAVAIHRRRRWAWLHEYLGSAGLDLLDPLGRLGWLEQVFLIWNLVSAALDWMHLRNEQEKASARVFASASDSIRLQMALRQPH
jgi:hypothetical protein